MAVLHLYSCGPGRLERCLSSTVGSRYNAEKFRYRGPRRHRYQLHLACLSACPVYYSRPKRPTKPKTGVNVAYVKIQAHEVTLSANKLLVTPAQIVAEFETSNSMKTSLSRPCTRNGRTRWYFETKSQRSVSKCVVTGERLFLSLIHISEPTRPY